MKNDELESQSQASSRPTGKPGRKLSAAVGKTIATVPEVVAVLTGDEEDGPRLVTVLAERTDETIGRVAAQELTLMRELGGVGFDFWTAPEAHLRSYRDAGYTTVFERSSDPD